MMKNGHYPSDSQGRRPAPHIARLAPKWPAAGILALLALALAAVLLWPSPAEAQMATVLVKNTDQTADGTARDLTRNASKRAQAFTTGANAGGYTLSSLGFDFDNIEAITTAGAQLTVTLNEVSGDDPGTALCTLTDPATFSSSGVHTFDAPKRSPCPTLTANTTYFAVIERVIVTTDNTELKVTTSGSEDTGGAMNWSISNDRHYFQGTLNMWTSNMSEAHLIEVKAFVGIIVQEPEPFSRATGFDLDGNNSAPRGIWGNDNTFWVANDGSGTTHKLYAYNRSDGSRDSASDFNNLQGNSNNQPEGICSRDHDVRRRQRRQQGLRLQDVRHDRRLHQGRHPGKRQ